MKYLKRFFESEELTESDLENDIIDFFLSELDYEDIKLKKKNLILMKSNEYFACSECGTIQDNGMDTYDCYQCGNKLILPSDDSYVEGAWKKALEYRIINPLTNYQNYEYIIKSGKSYLGLMETIDVYKTFTEWSDDALSDLNKKQISRLNTILKQHEMEIYSIDTMSELEYFIAKVSDVEKIIKKEYHPLMRNELNVVV
jgi:hypothetical protein